MRWKPLQKCRPLTTVFIFIYWLVCFSFFFSFIVAFLTIYLFSFFRVRCFWKAFCQLDVWLKQKNNASSFYLSLLHSLPSSRIAKHQSWSSWQRWHHFGLFCTCWRVRVIGARCLCRNPVLCRHQEAALWRRAQQLEPAVSLTSLSDVCQSYHDTDAELRLFIKHVSMFTEAPSCHRYPVGKPFWYVLSVSSEVFYFSVYLIICPFVDDILSLKSQSHILSSFLDSFMKFKFQKRLL